MPFNLQFKIKDTSTTDPLQEIASKAAAILATLPREAGKPKDKITQLYVHYTYPDSNTAMSIAEFTEIITIPSLRKISTLLPEGKTTPLKIPGDYQSALGVFEKTYIRIMIVYDIGIGRFVIRFDVRIER